MIHKFQTRTHTHFFNLFGATSGTETTPSPECKSNQRTFSTQATQCLNTTLGSITFPC